DVLAPALPMLPVLEVGVRDERPVAARPRLPQHHQPVRLAVGQGREHHAVDDAEDRGVGADAERQGDHRDGGERRLLAQRAQGKAYVLFQHDEILLAVLTSRAAFVRGAAVAAVLLHVAEAAQRFLLSESPHSLSTSPRSSRRCRATYREPSVTSSVPDVESRMTRATPWPCRGPHESALRTRTSSVPWRRSTGVAMVCPGVSRT